MTEKVAEPVGTLEVALNNASRLLSLDPSRLDKTEKDQGFHGYKVLGRTTLSKKDDRTALLVISPSRLRRASAGRRAAPG